MAEWIKDLAKSHPGIALFNFPRKSAFAPGDELPLLIARYYPALLYGTVPCHGTIG